MGRDKKTESLTVGAGLGAGAGAGGEGAILAGGGGDSSRVFLDDFFLKRGKPFMVIK